jgi:hypothetical protein
VEYDKLHEHPQAHILGELHHVTDEGRKVTGLAIYEQSVPASNVPPLNPAIRLVVVGDARQIKCTHAGCVRKERWEIGKAAFLALVQRYRPDLLGEEQKLQDQKL